MGLCCLSACFAVVPVRAHLTNVVSWLRVASASSVAHLCRRRSSASQEQAQREIKKKKVTQSHDGPLMLFPLIYNPQRHLPVLPHPPYQRLFLVLTRYPTPGRVLSAAASLRGRLLRGSNLAEQRRVILKYLREMH